MVELCTGWCFLTAGAGLGAATIHACCVDERIVPSIVNVMMKQLQRHWWVMDDKETLYCDNQHWGYFYAYHNRSGDQVRSLNVT